MTLDKQQELIDWAINKIEMFEKEKKLYNISAIILALLDVVCGILASYYSLMIVNAVVATILCGTVWGARTVQVIKCEKLAQAIKAMSIPSMAYIAVRKRRGDFMKDVKLRNIVIGVLTFLGFVSVILCHFIPALNGLVDYVIYYLCALLPADLYAVFNNAHKTAEEIQAKVDAKAMAKATKDAKAELEAKQKAELNELVLKKLEEGQAKTE